MGVCEEDDCMHNFCIAHRRTAVHGTRVKWLCACCYEDSDAGSLGSDSTQQLHFSNGSTQHVDIFETPTNTGSCVLISYSLEFEEPTTVGCVYRQLSD